MLHRTNKNSQLRVNLAESSFFFTSFMFSKINWFSWCSNAIHFLQFGVHSYDKGQLHFLITKYTKQVLVECMVNGLPWICQSYFSILRHYEKSLASSLLANINLLFCHITRATVLIYHNKKELECTLTNCLCSPLVLSLPRMN